MPFCFVYGCSSGSVSKASKDLPHRSFFFPPKDPKLFEEWEKSCHRADRVLDYKKRVCDLHFHKEEIIRATVITTATGEVISYPLDRCRLKPGAIPSIFPNCPKYLTKETVKRKAPTVSKNTTSPIENRVTKKVCLERESQSEIPSSSATIGFGWAGYTKTEIDGVKLPSESWTKRTGTTAGNTLHYYYQIKCENLEATIEKLAVVDFGTQSITYSVLSMGMCDTPEELNSFSSIQQLEKNLSIIDSATLCPGLTTNKFLSINPESVNGGEYVGRTWRAYKCPLLNNLHEIIRTDYNGSDFQPNERKSNTEVCQHCNNLKKALERRLRRHAVKGSVKLFGVNLKYLPYHTISKKLRNATRRQSRLTIKLAMARAKVKRLELQLNNLTREFSEFKEDSLTKALNELKDEKAKLAIRTIFARAKCVYKFGRDMRYETEWLLECLLLRIKSPEAYEHMRSNKFLPLPSRERLRAMLSGLSCHFGFNKFALEAIEKILEGKSLAECYGSLMLDEVSIEETIDFNTETFQFDGFINLKDNTVQEDQTIVDEENDVPVEEQVMADHALVFMFRTYKSAWVQPFAVFASKSATPGADLHRLLLKALILLEARGAKVLSVVSDGAAPNQSMWTYCGVSGKNTETLSLNHKMEHPSGGHDIFFMRDVPHLFKCIRNHFFTHGNVQAGGKTVRWSDLQALYDEDCTPGGLRVCSRLRMIHLNPTNFQKMTVSLAVQIFSKSVANGLHFYRTHPTDEGIREKFKDTKALEDLIMLLNDSFDVMNSRCRINGITKENWEENSKIL